MHSIQFLSKLLNNKINCPYLLEKVKINTPNINLRNDNFRPFNININAYMSPIDKAMRNYNEISEIDRNNHLCILSDQYNIFERKLLEIMNSTD